MNIPNPTVLEQGKVAAAQAAHHFATVLLASWTAFWQRPTEACLADLNADIADIAETFTINTQAGESVNALLDVIGDARFSSRAPTSLPPGYAFDGEAWIYTPPPEPEP